MRRSAFAKWRQVKGLPGFHSFLRYTAQEPTATKGFFAFMSVKVVRDLENETEKLVASEDFPALEQKIYKTIELLKSARGAKAAAERDAGRLRDQLEQREEELEMLRSEVVSLRKEREEVRGRLEKMLKQIDVLVAEG
jgi:chromosome segregation ATPase